MKEIGFDRLFYAAIAADAGVAGVKPDTDSSILVNVIERPARCRYHA